MVAYSTSNGAKPNDFVGKGYSVTDQAKAAMAAEFQRRLAE
jgi:C4-dicarboxylate-specific signal transduction histidine kinase